MVSVEEEVKRIKKYHIFEVNCLKMSLDNFNKLCKDLTDEKAWIEIESGEWFWVMTEDCSGEECIKKMEKFLNVSISIKKLFVDIQNSIVIIQLRR